MALVVLLRGVNVGGHRRFRPSVLARELKRFDVRNIGAAGTFVVLGAVGRRQLRAEIARRLPFQADVMICDGRDVLELVSDDPFADQPARPEILRFVSVLARRRLPLRGIPLSFPSDAEWCLRILDHRDQFVVGVHRREMRALRYLDRMEKVFGVPLTTRSWTTILQIARVLEA